MTTFFKQKAPPDKKRLARIREMACIVCGTPPPSDAAHLRFGHTAGMGQKPPDYLAVPLCRRHHVEEHAEGPPKFWKRQLSTDVTLAYRSLHALAKSL